MSDIHKLTFIEKRERLKNSVFKSLHDVSEFLGRVLLHATIRQHHESRPILCVLYVEKAEAEEILESVHIVHRDPEGDQLWIGFDELVTDINIAVGLPEVRDQLYEGISDCIDTTHKKILDAKDGNYLLHHGTDKILDGSQPFDVHPDRFTFALFVGYDSSLLTEPEAPGFEDDLKRETAVPSGKFAADLIGDLLFANLCVYVFVYPVPSLKRLTQLVDEKMRGIV